MSTTYHHPDITEMSSAIQAGTAFIVNDPRLGYGIFTGDDDFINFLSNLRWKKDEIEELINNKKIPLIVYKGIKILKETDDELIFEYNTRGYDSYNYDYHYWNQGYYYSKYTKSELTGLFYLKSIDFSPERSLSIDEIDE